MNAMNPELNDDVEGVIKSFIPHSTRLLSLRQKYKIAHLKEGLQKKTVKQLQHILVNIIETVKTGFLSDYKQWFYTIGVDIQEALTRVRIPFGFLHKYESTLGNKEAKVNRILEFYKRACDIASQKSISRFYYQYQANGNRTLNINQNKHLRGIFKQDLSQRVIKLLCILNIVIKATKAKKPKAKVPKANNTTTFTEVD